ncbi:hypothetical protein GCM10010923_17620 [Blastomonas marina]|jgi:hypothetical protein|uniref:Uncharacterized protein n=1 Tax=Blastomonas marina TaxID=1867408 RepID=A0ABQ1FEP5_9SPHN|nr:hypothetical protein [Blastomonas marina]GGA07984.1 hypothetical protein GCM10010923_17620 [Blastomonas marina]
MKTMFAAMSAAALLASPAMAAEMKCDMPCCEKDADGEMACCEKMKKAGEDGGDKPHQHPENGEPAPETPATGEE